MTLVLRDVTLPLAHFTLEVSLELNGSATALYGPSGSGKTSLLEVIAGLRRPKGGMVVLNGRVVFDGRLDVPPRHRRVGYVPQDDALFPHMSVRRNILYGARSRDESLERVAHVLEIEPLLERGIPNLSGGERKRIALARALLTDPEILLLDEPLSGLDLDLRTRVLEYLVRVRDEFPVPLLYVTHQIEEAAAVCEELVRMERGRIVGRMGVRS